MVNFRGVAVVIFYYVGGPSGIRVIFVWLDFESRLRPNWTPKENSNSHRLFSPYGFESPTKTSIEKT